jgi:glutathione S-transferase
MSEFVLHCFDKSGNAYKVALMLNLSDADWQPHFVDYMNGETRTEEFRKQNSMGEIPVLAHQGLCLSQSGVILDYLAEKLGKFGPENNTERREILRWILFDNHKLTSYTATLRFIRALTDQGESEVTDFLETRSRTALKVLDDHLKNSSFAIGDRITIADFSMCGYLYFQDEIGIDFTEYPNVSRWLAEIQDMEGWAHPYDLMPSG